MSDPVKHGHHEHAEYEREDLTARSVFTFLLGLVVMGVVVVGILKVLTGGLESYNRSHQPPQNPLATKIVPVPENTRTDQSRTAIKAAFPEPRLEEDEIHELRDFREAEEQKLYTYGEDPSTGTLHIPIERAMQLIAQRGLPTQVKAGVTPASTVNTAQQAAEKADTSAKPKAKNKK
jgi:hypothetical protein